MKHLCVLERHVLEPTLSLYTGIAVTDTDTTTMVYKNGIQLKLYTTMHILNIVLHRLHTITIACKNGIPSKLV